MKKNICYQVRNLAKAVALLTPIAILPLMTSCTESWLEVEKPDGETLEEYFTTLARIEESLVAAYDPIHWHDWGLGQYNAYNIDSDIMSDDFWVGGSDWTDMQHWHMIANFEADANNTLSTLWTIDYSGVKRCNDCLRYIPWCTTLTAREAQLTEMQARTLRVFYYNNLWHLFGNIPFYLTNLNAPYTAPQITADEVYGQLIPELEAVIDSRVLPNRWDDQNAGRTSQAFAVMLYAEMVAYQNDTERFGRALGYLREFIINSGEYELFPNFKDYWDTDNEWNKESIYEINYDQTKSERDWGTGQSVGGMVIPTLISPNSYGDDTWSNNDGWGFLPVRFDVRDELLKDDGRLEGTVWDLTDATYTMRSDDTHLWLQKYRPYNKNYENGTSSPNLNYGNNYRMYRYSEALLYAAEFALRTGDAGAAKTYVDPVRQRAGIATAAAYTLDDILTERHKEFVGEGKRYFDLVRAELITDQPVSNDNKASTRLVPTQSDALSGVSYGRTKAWTAQKKYIPIAQAELDSDPALKQNSDYFN